MSPIKMLKEWLEKPENTKVKLASALGYNSSTVVDQWLKRKRIPKHAQARLIKIIGG